MEVFKYFYYLNGLRFFYSLQTYKAALSTTPIVWTGPMGPLHPRLFYQVHSICIPKQGTLQPQSATCHKEHHTPYFIFTSPNWTKLDTGKSTICDSYNLLIHLKKYFKLQDSLKNNITQNVFIYYSLFGNLKNKFLPLLQGVQYVGCSRESLETPHAIPNNQPKPKPTHGLGVCYFSQLTPLHVLSSIPHQHCSHVTLPSTKQAKQFILS